MRVVLIDDERLAREELKSMLAKFPHVEIVGEAKSAEEGIELIQEMQPDVVYLDIQMPEMNGFELVQQLTDVPHIIFVTAYDDHAIEAFRVNAIDYLLKPVEAERLAESIEKVRLKLDEEDFTTTQKLGHQQPVLTLTDRVFIKEGEKCFFPKVADIRYFESHGNYVRIFFNDHKPLLLKSLNSIEERLPADSFFRANRKYIVNLNYVRDVTYWFNGRLNLHLEENLVIEISRRQAVKFKESLSL